MRGLRNNLQPGTLAIAVARSANEKIGDAATTYAAQGSCPSSCVFKDGGGCYAETGGIGKFVTEPLNQSSEAILLIDENYPLAHEKSARMIARAEAEAIDDMEVEPGRPLRLHTVGDCSTDEAAQIVAAAAERYMARGGGPVWTYTHGWREVERASWARVSVLASCESLVDVLEAQARGYATAIVVEEFESDKRYEIAPAEGSHRHAVTLARVPGSRSARGGGAVAPPASPTTLGRQNGTSDLENRIPAEARIVPTDGFPPSRSEVLPCPAQTRGRSCVECRLCFDDEALRERGYSIGFEVHGAPVTRRFALKALRTPDAPERRLTSRVLIPRFEASFEHEHGRLPSHVEVARALDMNPSSVYDMRKKLAAGA